MLSESISVEFSMYLFSEMWACVFICVGTCLLVLSFFHVRMYVHTGECVHAELFVAGLAPWEPFLHLSIPHSRALILPEIHQQLTLFLSGTVDPIISRQHSLPSPCFLTHTVCLTPPFSLTYTLTKAYLCSPYALTHSGTVTVTPTHSRL